MSFLIYIVSTNTQQAHLLKSYLDSILEVSSVCHSNLSLGALVENTPDCPCVYLLDCLKRDVGAIDTFLEIGPNVIPDNIMIVLYNIHESHELSTLVKRYKIRGIFHRVCSPSIFIKGINTILAGNLWLSRKMLADCILATDQTLDEPFAPEPVVLSRREKEALQRVVFGESNQEIADAMNISLHTVKTHLYNAYKKIKVPNRLQAALWAAMYLRYHSN